MVFVSVAEHYHISLLLGTVYYVARHHGKEAVGYVGQDHSDCPVVSAPEYPCRIIRMVIVPVHDLLYFLRGLLADPVNLFAVLHVGQYGRNEGTRYPSLFRYVVDGKFLLVVHCSQKLK